MSGVGEALAIVACVAAVVSAYKDGGVIINKIKIKRALKRAAPPSRLLEESIDNAPQEIENEKQRGIARFGRAFEDGDPISVIALQQITIQLQKTLLEKLRNAAFDDEVTDFTLLVDQADDGRDSTIRVLLDLKQRLMLATPINELSLSTVTSNESRPVLVQPNQIQQNPKQSPNSPTAGKQGKPIWAREYAQSPTSDGSGDESATPGPEGKGRRRHSSLFGFLSKHSRSQSGSVTPVPKAIEEEKSVTSQPTGAQTSLPFRAPKPNFTRKASARPLAPAPSFTYQEWEDNPAEIWGPPSSEERDRQKSMAVAPNQPTTPPALVRSVSGTRFPGLSPTPSVSGIVPTPSPENNYLGFCKSAWRLQNGDRKSMQKCKALVDGWSSVTVDYLLCASSKCDFAGHGSMDKIWNKVLVSKSKGISFRWTFLAKSHVVQQKVKDRKYAYQCMFCVFLGEKAPVIHGVDYYLDHVMAHRGQMLGEVVLYKTKCITDHIAEDDEEFDVNLWPLSFQEAASRKQSTILSDDLLDAQNSSASRSNSETQDSMFSANEPWNAGLSDFSSWERDYFDRAELE